MTGGMYIWHRLILAYDDLISINYFGQWRKAYWTKEYADILEAVSGALEDKARVCIRSEALDAEIEERARILWCAAMAGSTEKVSSLITPVAQYLENTSSRVPFSDWYDTETGEFCAFIGRSVQGGIFMPMLIYNKMQFL